MATAALIGSLVLSAGSMVTKESQASLERGQAEVAASTEELRLAQREGDRKDRLASALSSQNAMAGASGIAAFEGSPLTILNDSIERERVGTERDKFSTEISNMALRSGAKIRQRMSNINSRLGFFQSAAGLASVGGGN